jgi:hypothetical protein
MPKLGNNIETNITGVPILGKIYFITLYDVYWKSRKRVKYATT